jgi:hypothetical protein
MSDRVLTLSMTRSLPAGICRVLIGVVLLAQLAVSAYACPSMSGVTPMTDEVAANQAPAMDPGCNEVDADAANLCVEHCRFGQQSADTPANPLPAPAILAPLYLLPDEPQRSSDIVARTLCAPVDDRVAAPPPHAIVHCVYRI